MVDSLYRLVPMQTSLKELQRKYRDISGERNELFHGKRTTRVSVATIEAAQQALDWINTNMWPQNYDDSTE